MTYQHPGAQALDEAASELLNKPAPNVDPQKLQTAIGKWLQYRAAAMQINNNLANERLIEQLKDKQ